MKQRLDKKYVYQLSLGYLIYGFFMWLFVVMQIALSLMSEDFVMSEGFALTLPVILFATVLYVGVVYLIAYLWWKNYTYELQPESFEKHFGIISLRNTNIPYERIQNININRPLISRIFGLSQLHIQTAGNSGIVAAEGRLPGLSYAVAEKLRDDLIHRSRGGQPTTQQHTQHTGTQKPIRSDHSGGL